jgi:hypothetical protein
MYSPRTSRTFLASKPYAMSRYAFTRSTWNRCTLGLKSTSPTATQATLMIGNPARSHSSLMSFALPDVGVERVGEDVDGVEADLLRHPDAEGGLAARLGPGGVDQAKFHGVLHGLNSRKSGDELPTSW